MPDQLNFDAAGERVALVTGAARGIGRAVARRLAAEGRTVGVLDRNGDEAEALAAEIRAADGRAYALTADVANAAEVETAVAELAERVGPPTILVNNAGILRDNLLFRMSEDDWDQIMNVHLKGHFLVTRAVQAHMVQAGWGRIVNLSSTSATGNRGQANYSAAKLGIVGLSKSIALDMQKYNVRSNCIAPFAWSRMISSIPTETPEEIARVNKLKQMTPAKIAPLAVYLASDAATNVNGQIFAVRNNEIFLISQPRPVRSVHRSEGWTPESIASHAMPALQSAFHSLDVSADVFTWDPV